MTKGNTETSPAPWTVVEEDGLLTLRDGRGLDIAYYFPDEEAGVVISDEDRANFRRMAEAANS